MRSRAKDSIAIGIESNEEGLPSEGLGRQRSHGLWRTASDWLLLTTGLPGNTLVSSSFFGVAAPRGGTGASLVRLGTLGEAKKELQQGLEPWTPRFFRSETSFSEREIGSLESRKCMLETEASEGAEVQKYLRMLYPLSYTDSVRNVIKTTIVSTKLDVSGKRSQKSLTEHQRDKSTRHISTFSGICRALPFRVSVPFPRKCCRSCSSAPLAVDFAFCSLWLEQMPGGCSVGVPSTLLR